MGQLALIVNLFFHILILKIDQMIYIYIYMASNRVFFIILKVNFEKRTNSSIINIGYLSVEQILILDGFK